MSASAEEFREKLEALMAEHIDVLSADQEGAVVTGWILAYTAATMDEPFGMVYDFESRSMSKTNGIGLLTVACDDRRARG